MTESGGNWIVTLAMFGWIPAVAIAFMVLTPPRAAVIGYIAGWLFLPVAQFPLAGLPDYTKHLAVPLVILLAILLCDGRRLLAFKPRLVDLPIALYCLVPLFSSLSNGLGWYDGITSVFDKSIVWGVPYLTGRLYCSSPEGRDRLAWGLLVGGLLYAPLCLWEIRMSPQLHHTVYGYHQHDWSQTLRPGGYRPMVFMHHGLMVGLWMAAATLAGFALWTGGVARRVLGLPLWIVVPFLFVVTMLCKSLGAIVLLGAGIASLVSMRSLRFSLPVAILLCLPFVWVGARIAGVWDWSGISRLTGSIEAQRSESLQYRIHAEDVLLERALEQPVLGWGGWDRSRPATDRPSSRSQETIATDSLWIITIGRYGLVGLAMVMLALAVPVVTLWRRQPPRLWDADRRSVVAWALGLVLLVYAIDSVFNDMENPVYLLVAGGLAGLAAVPARRAHAAPRARPHVVPLPRPGVPVRTLPSRGPR